MPEKVKAVVMTAPGKLECRNCHTRIILNPERLLLKMEMRASDGTDKHAYKGEVTLYGGTQSNRIWSTPAFTDTKMRRIVYEMNGEGRISNTWGPLKIGDRVTNCPNVICGHCWYCRNVHGYPYCTEHQGIGMTYYSASLSLHRRRLG